MANAEHVEIVKKGAHAVAQWRIEHPDLRLDLDGAELQGVNLSRVQFGPVNLDGARLEEAQLRGANLDEAFLKADLRHADLSRASLVRAYAFDADFSDATLYETKLLGASLQGARFRGSDLTLASLHQANLTGADLSGATLVLTILAGAKLSRTKLSQAVFHGTVLTPDQIAQTEVLEDAIHLGPSSIDHRTLAKSGELPLAFLRGIGLPDELIDFYRAQYGKPIQFYSCFISYARRDEEFVDRLYADLQESGVRCWRDTEDMKIGDRMRPVIDRAIRLHDKVVLVLSEHSIASDWVEQEVETAFEREDRQRRDMLFPVRVDDSIMRTRRAWAGSIRRTRNIGDFRKWKDHDRYQEAFQRVLRDLRADDS